MHLSLLVRFYSWRLSWVSAVGLRTGGLDAVGREPNALSMLVAVAATIAPVCLPRHHAPARQFVLAFVAAQRDPEQRVVSVLERPCANIDRDASDADRIGHVAFAVR